MPGDRRTAGTGSTGMVRILQLKLYAWRVATAHSDRVALARLYRFTFIYIAALSECAVGHVFFACCTVTPLQSCSCCRATTRAMAQLRIHSSASGLHARARARAMLMYGVMP